MNFSITTTAVYAYRRMTCALGPPDRVAAMLDREVAAGYERAGGATRLKDVVEPDREVYAIDLFDGSAALVVPEDGARMRSTTILGELAAVVISVRSAESVERLRDMGRWIPFGVPRRFAPARRDVRETPRLVTSPGVADALVQVLAESDAERARRPGE